MASWRAGPVAYVTAAIIAVVAISADAQGRPPAGGTRQQGETLPPQRPASLPRAAPAEIGTDQAAKPAEAGPPAPSCTAGLSASHGDGVAPIDPARLHAGLDEACHVDEPVLVRRLTLHLAESAGGPENSVELALDPPAAMGCALAVSLAHWARIGLQPLVWGYFSRRVATLRVGGGHECRRRNRSTAGPLSQHATGRALDIFGFVLEGARRPSDEPGRSGGSARDTGRGESVISVEAPIGPQQIAFLEAVRQSACGAFATVLGPGSDAAHASHVHLDIQQRRSGASRFCQ